MTQFFQYDNRNRLKAMRWSNGMDFADLQYDAASHLTSAVNPYSSITRGYDNAGRLTLDRQVLTTSLNAAALTVTPLSVVSRQSHGAAGVFNIALPLTGAPGVECRSTSGSYTIVLTFAHAVTVGGASISSGVGSVGSVSVDGAVVTVNLINVSDMQRMAIKVFDIVDGTTIGEVTVPMHILIGDVSGNGLVNSSDKQQVDAQSGFAATASNFRCDVNLSGTISGTDGIIVNSRSGDGVPPAPLAGPSFDVSYEHDNDGRVSRLFVPSATYDFSYDYDGLGRLQNIRVGNSSSPSYAYDYDKNSNVSWRNNVAGNSSQTYINDELNRKAERRINASYYVDGSTTPQSYIFSREEYAYDPMGRLQSRLRTLTSPGASPAMDKKQDTFAYKDNGELSGADYDRVWNGTTYVSPARSVTYTLDNAGNRTGVSETKAGATTNTNYTPDHLNQYAETGHGSEHEVSEYAGSYYHYLGDGRLSSVSRPGENSLYELGYDALGRCVRRTTNHVASYYAYDGEREILEYDGSGNPLSSTVYGNGLDEIIARKNNGAWQWLFQDYLGSTSAIALADGSIKEQYRYDAFGTPEIRSEPVAGNPRGTLQASGTMINNRVLFTGRLWAAKYGFYEYRARAYNPELGRFMSEDPMGIQTRGVKPSAASMPNIAPGQMPKEFMNSEVNLFAYCHNDPLDLTDPMGLIFTIIGGDKDWQKKTAADLRKVERDLQKAVKNRVQGAKQALQEFRTLKNDPNYEVKITPAGKTAAGANNYNTKTIGYEAYKTDTSTARDTSGSTNRDASIGLGHEVGHAVDDYYGRIPVDHSAAEAQAVRFENIVRAGRWPNDPDRQRPQY